MGGRCWRAARRRLTLVDLDHVAESTSTARCRRSARRWAWPRCARSRASSADIHPGCRACTGRGSSRPENWPALLPQPVDVGHRRLRPVARQAGAMAAWSLARRTPLVVVVGAAGGKRRAQAWKWPTSPRPRTTRCSHRCASAAPAAWRPQRARSACAACSRASRGDTRSSTRACDVEANLKLPRLRLDGERDRAFGMVAGASCADARLSLGPLRGLARRRYNGRLSPGFLGGKSGSLAQSVEQRTFNPVGRRFNPARPPSEPTKFGLLARLVEQKRTLSRLVIPGILGHQRNNGLAATPDVVVWINTRFRRAPSSTQGGRIQPRSRSRRRCNSQRSYELLRVPCTRWSSCRAYGPIPHSATQPALAAGARRRDEAGVEQRVGEARWMLLPRRRVMRDHHRLAPCNSRQFALQPGGMA